MPSAKGKVHIYRMAKRIQNSLVRIALAKSVFSYKLARRNAARDIQSASIGEVVGAMSYESGIGTNYWRTRMPMPLGYSSSTTAARARSSRCGRRRR